MSDSANGCCTLHSLRAISAALRRVGIETPWPRKYSMNRSSIRSRKLTVAVFLKSRSTMGPDLLFGHPLIHPRNFAECRSEEHTSELQSLMRISYAVFYLKKNTHTLT